MTLLITDEAVEAGLRAGWPSALSLKPDIQEHYRKGVRAALEAALPHLKASTYDLVGGLGYELGRRDAAEAIADALKKRRDEAREKAARGWPLLTEAAVIAREFATRPSEPLTSPDGAS